MVEPIHPACLRLLLFGEGATFAKFLVLLQSVSVRRNAMKPPLGVGVFPAALMSPLLFVQEPHQVFENNSLGLWLYSLIRR